jgi:hypothetical protein
MGAHMLLKTQIALLCVLGACSEQLELSSSDQEVNVTFQNAVGVSVNGNSLTKTAAQGWGNAGASSTQSINSDGFVEFSTLERNKAKIAGLSNGDSGQADTDVDFGIVLNASGNVVVREAGADRGQFGTYNAGDVLRVEVVERVVRYYRNGALLFTSTKAPVLPLLLDTALNQTGSTITNAVISDFVFTNTVGVDVLSTTSIRKTAGLGNGFGNSGAISVRSIKADTGFTQFSSGETTATKAAGLSNGDPDQNASSIDFGWLLTANGAAQVIETGTPRFTDTVNWTTTDVFRVEVVQNAGVSQVRYFKNGTQVFVSAQAVTYPLTFDSAFDQAGGTLTNVALDDTFWTNVVGADAIGNTLFGTVPRTQQTCFGSGAHSLATIASGDGFVEFSTNENNRSKAVGLSNGDSNQSDADIDFAIVLSSSGLVTVKENGVSKGTFGPYAAGEVFRVNVTANVVTYLRNGQVFFTSAKVPTFPLLADASICDTGSTITNTVMTGGAGDGIPRDPISGFAVPLTQADWNLVFAAAGVTPKTVNQSWSFQDSSGDAQAAIGSPLVASTGADALDYQQDVPGWARKAIVFQPDGGIEFLFQPRTIIDGPDPTVESVLMFTYASVDPVAATRRIMVIAGGSTNANLLSVTSTGNLRLVCDGSQTIGTATATGPVRPLMLQYDRTNSRAVAYSDQEIITGVFSANVSSSTRGWGTSNNTGSSGVQRNLLGTQFKGVNAEWTEAEVRAVYNVLINGAVPW